MRSAESRAPEDRPGARVSGLGIVAGPPERVYAERKARFDARREELTARLRALGRWRLATLTAAIGIAWWGSAAAAPAARAVAYIASLALIVGFALLVRRHRMVARERRRAAALAQLNAEGLARLERRWSALPPSMDAPAEHPYARDLDVLGEVSLWRLLGPASPALGASRLREWLLAPASPGAVRRRQAAVAELASRVELREALAVAARLGRPLDPQALARFLAWVAAPPGARRSTALLWGARLLGAATTVLLLAWLTEPSRPAWWALPAAVNVLLTALAVRRARRELAEAAGSAATLGGVAESLELAASERFSSPALAELAAEVGGSSGHDAAASVRRLQRLVALAELRYSPMMHAVVNAFTLLDVQVLGEVERWRASAGSSAAGWFAALSELEALSAIATLAHDHPAWSFPELVEQGAPLVEARALGHPLLPDATRIPNDVTVGPPGTFLLVTGSNMSGKSTLLRAIGANVVLAQAGAPVCATSMRLSPLDVRTSVRVEDSLERGVSLFMAELLRLRTVVDAARRARREGGASVLFLLDEILHGTNTAERQIAARRILLHLVEEGAIGAVTTHDLALADEAPLREIARAVHFNERFEPARDGASARMTFDYVLRPGLATSVNALKLMEMVGLG